MCTFHCTCVIQYLFCSEGPLSLLHCVISLFYFTLYYFMYVCMYCWLLYTLYFIIVSFILRGLLSTHFFHVHLFKYLSFIVGWMTEHAEPLPKPHPSEQSKSQQLLRQRRVRAPHMIGRLPEHYSMLCEPLMQEEEVESKGEGATRWSEASSIGTFTSMFSELLLFI